MRGGARKGAGRKKDPSKQIRVKETTLKKLDKSEGKTWNEKIEKLLKHIRPEPKGRQL